MVAAILHLGNIDFGKGEEIDSSDIKDEKSRFHLNMAAELLMYAQSFLTISETICPFLVQWIIHCSPYCPLVLTGVTPRA